LIEFHPVLPTFCFFLRGST